MRSLKIFMLFSIGLAACASTQNLKPTAEFLPLAQQKFPGITLQDLQHGYKIYIINCSGCHSIYQPQNYAAAQWDTILPPMLLKAHMDKPIEQTLLRQYLIYMSK